MNHTVDYYNKNARQYYDSTIDADLSSQIQKFAALLSPGARIIDVGCGSGRDTKAFCDLGFKASGIDASDELAAMAADRLGIDVTVGDMSSWIADEPYDGMWCCAVLMHLTDEERDSFLGNLRHNLKPGGVVFFSVKEGIETGEDDKGRYMRNYTEAEITDCLRKAGCRIIQISRSTDKLGREEFGWLNVLCRA